MHFFHHISTCSILTFLWRIKTSTGQSCIFPKWLFTKSIFEWNCRMSPTNAKIPHLHIHKPKIVVVGQWEPRKWGTPCMEMFVPRFCLQLIPESLTKKIDLTKPEIFLLLGPRFCSALSWIAFSFLFSFLFQIKWHKDYKSTNRTKKWNRRW